jgi:hypothetical protein
VLDAGIVDQDVRRAESRSQRVIIASIAAGSDMSAPSCSAPSSPHRRAISPGSPNPLIISFAPSAASARAIASPMPDVEPVTSATLPSRIM